MGFQCATSKEKQFIQLKDGKDLMCISPDDFEQFLKACKKDHRVLAVTVCKFFELDPVMFTCAPPDGQSFPMSIDQVDNYFCVSPSDRRRIEERCK